MKKKFKDNEKNIAIGLATSEVVNRYGSANAEFLKGLRGHDFETGQSFERGLEDISKYKINPDYAERNIKQQAGFSAEVAKTGRDNAENIISGKKERTYRSEDVPGYGSNNTVSDHVVLDKSGNIIEQSQMKFVKKPTDLVDKIASGNGGGKNDLSRYLENDFIDLPTEQVEIAKAHAARQADNFSKQAQRALDDGKPELADNLQQKANNFKKLESKIRDSGITEKEAKNYRLSPKIETAKDIASVSHRAGIEGAKFGAAIGGTIAVATNILALSKGDKEFSEAALDSIVATSKAAGVGYVSAYLGASLKGAMQQSSQIGIRALSNSSIPSLVVSTCIQLGSSISNYVKGEIDEKALLHATAMTTSSLMASTAGAILGQIAIPVPIVGAMIGGMVGHTITAMFYQSFLAVIDSAEYAHERYLFIKQKCEAARALNEEYQKELKMLVTEKIQWANEVQSELLLSLVDIDLLSGEEFASRANSFAEKLGQSLPFDTQEEFDVFMASDDILVL